MTVADAVGRDRWSRGGIDTRRSASSGRATSTSPTRWWRAGARFVAARHEGGAATMADAYARMSGRPAAVTRAPGLRPDQRDDRHHRGGQEPHPAGRPGRRGDRSRGRTSTSTRRRWPRRSARCRCGSTRPATAAEQAAAAVATARAGAARGPAEPAAGRAGAGGRRATAGAGAAASAGRRLDADGVAAAGRRPARRRGGRCSWPAAVPGARRRAALEDARRPVRRAAGHLGGGEGPVRRQPVVARRLRRLRLAAGRRADRRRRPDRRLGLRAQHVDDAARPADRRRTPSSCRSTSTPTPSAPTATSTFGVVGDVRRDGRGGGRPRSARPGPAGYRTDGGARRRSRERVRWRDVPYDDAGGGGPDRPADA